ncbi:MAG: hypothetical protein UHM23_08845 [Clostridia bacterium]|nr:hypothetical protein [Clostridia bacterium]
MRENERERLYYLFQESKCPMHFLDNKEILDTVDYLLENGVVVPPCKVGDAVYAITLNTKTSIVAIHRGYIGSIDIRSAGNYMFICHEGLDDEPFFENICCKFENFGKTVFFTKEDAERALKGGATE